MDYKELVRAEALRQGVDPNLALAVAEQESGWNPKARSKAGAIGLFQLMPATAKELGVNPDDPVQNIRGGITYLKEQTGRFGLEGGLYAYNGGPGRFQQVAGDVSKLPEETRNYAPAVLKRFQKYGGNVEQQTQQPTFAQLEAALERARADNNQTAVDKILGRMVTPLEQARERALADNNQAAVAKIEARIQALRGPGQAVATPVEPAAEIPAEQVGEPPAPPRTVGENLQRQGELFTRQAAEGLESAFTFPVKAVGEAVASGASLLGFPEAGKKISETVGMRTPMVSTTAADTLNLAKPETTVEKVVGAGTKALAGMSPNYLIQKAASGAPEMARQAVSALAPTVSSIPQAALVAGVGAGLEEAPMETAAGAAGIATVASLAAAAATRGRMRETAVNNAQKTILETAGGNKARAAADASIITQINKEANAMIRQKGGATQPLSASELNGKVAGAYIRQAQEAVNKLPKDFPNRQNYVTALSQGNRLSSSEIQALRTDKVGNAVADAIEQAQRASVLTQAIAARGGIAGTAARTAVETIPTVGSAVTGIPLVGMQRLTEGIKAAAGGRTTREQMGAKLINPNMVKAAEKTLVDYKAAPDWMKGIDTIEKIAKQASRAETAKQAAKQAGISQREAASTAAEQLRVRNLQLGIRSNPTFSPENLKIQGGTRGTLQYYGRLKDSKELAKGLRIIEKTDPYLEPYITSIKQNKNVPNKDLLLGITDRLLQLRDQGILSPFIK